MKKAGTFLVAMILMVAIANTGCTLSGGDIVLPNVANLSIQSLSTFVPGDSVLVTLYSTTLIPGAYEIHYSLGGANVANGQTAEVNLLNDTCSFYTIVMANAGISSLTITEITNSSGGNASTDVYKTFSDSTGQMASAISVAGSGFSAQDVNATLTGTLLTIKGTYWKPLETITLNIDNYTHSTGSYTLNAGGTAIYTIPGATDSSVDGVVNITATSPLLTGTFSFTCKDSTRLSSGTFSCVAP